MTSDREIVKIKLDTITLEGELTVPEKASGLIIFSHGSGSSRFSPRNNFVAQQLHRRGLATFLFDLLTSEEDKVYSNRFNIPLLSTRLVEVTKELSKHPKIKSLKIGYFGASTGAASALDAASVLGKKIYAIVSRGGRPDLAIHSFESINAPTLFIVGELDYEVVKLNRKVFEKLPGIKSLREVPGATHLFEAPGALEEVAQLSADWFEKYLDTHKAEETETHFAHS
jgi:pimeloyl-ACP methyl ester carboxylesterase